MLLLKFVDGLSGFVKLLLGLMTAWIVFLFYQMIRGKRPLQSLNAKLNSVGESFAKSKMFQIVDDPNAVSKIDKMIDSRFAAPFPLGPGASDLANFLKAQYRLESGFLRPEGPNTITKKHNNIFSMKESKVRPSDWDYLTDIIESDGNLPFVGYYNVSRAVTDLKKWWDYNKLPYDIETPEDFVELLHKKGYFTFPPRKYLAAIKKNLTDMGLEEEKEFPYIGGNWNPANWFSS